MAVIADILANVYEHGLKVVLVNTQWFNSGNVSVHVLRGDCIYIKKAIHNNV